MELIERDDFLTLLQTQFKKTAGGEGHCAFIGGEAGIGKTSLVKEFCKSLQGNGKIYRGTCDALFTPRPLAPLYDIAWQISHDFWTDGHAIEDRAALFAKFLRELSDQQQPIIVVFEDIHWADEATLDFIKFFSRRITQLRCLFILTYRDNEIHRGHPLRNVFSQLSPDSFTRIALPVLSKQAVEKLAGEKGFNGQEVYNISGGNPFYVNEILASYSQGIPENIKDAVLSVYNSQDEQAKKVWELLSVIPTSLHIKHLDRLEPSYTKVIEECLERAILVIKEGGIFFKHELFRRTIETSLSPLKRVALNKKILELFREDFEQQGNIERIIHHAKNANEYEMVVHFAPVAAKNAIQVGSHTEACKLYLSAIEYYQGNDKDLLVELYEAYAYECYLTNKMKEAIIYTTKAMQVWKEKDNAEKTGNSLRFLSRLWWYEGNRRNAENFAAQAIEILEKEPASSTKAMAFSNMAQLNMLSKETEKCLFWGEKAIAMANELNNEEILSHALNNVGSVQVNIQETRSKGIELLQQSLAIALKNGYHEHAARAYTNLSSNSVLLKDYALSKKALDDGIRFCEERDLNSWSAYMLSWKSRLMLETGNWEEAHRIADNLLKNDDQPSVIKISVLAVLATLKLRKGDPDALPLLKEANTRALEAGELQRIIPAFAASFEYEWITGKIIVDEATIDLTLELMKRSDSLFENSELIFWLIKARNKIIPFENLYEGYDISTQEKALKAAALWKQVGCRYEQALTLFEGDDDNKREAISIVQELGATAVYEKMKQEMRNSGIKKIPRGLRESTLSNPAQLTNREIDILQLLQQNMQNKEIAAALFISAKTVDHHISSLLFKLDVNSRAKAVQEGIRLGILK